MTVLRTPVYMSGKHAGVSKYVYLIVFFDFFFVFFRKDYLHAGHVDFQLVSLLIHALEVLA